MLADVDGHYFGFRRLAQHCCIGLAFLLRSVLTFFIGFDRQYAFRFYPGSRPVGVIVHERLRSALSDLNGNALNRSPAAPVRGDRQRRTWTALHDELQRLRVPGKASHVLGPNVGADYDQAARVSAFSLFEADLAVASHAAGRRYAHSDDCRKSS